MLTSIFSKLVLESGAIVQNLTKWTTCVENPVIYDGAQTIKQIYIPLRTDAQQPQGGGKGMPTFSTVTQPWYINKFPNIPNNREFDITIKSRILGPRVQLRAVFLALDPSSNTATSIDLFPECYSGKGQESEQRIRLSLEHGTYEYIELDQNLQYQSVTQPKTARQSGFVITTQQPQYLAGYVQPQVTSNLDGRLWARLCNLTFHIGLIDAETNLEIGREGVNWNSRIQLNQDRVQRRVRVNTSH